MPSDPRSLTKLGVEDLHLDVAVVPRGGDHLEHAGQIDVAIAHDPAREQWGLHQWHDPVRDLEGGDASRGALDLCGQVGVPPHVVGVDDDAHGLGSVVLGEVERLPEHREHGSVGAEHRMERLECELQDIDAYTVPLGLRLFLDSAGVSSFGPRLAMGVLSLPPAIVIFLCFQRLIVEGIATSGLGAHHRDRRRRSRVTDVEIVDLDRPYHGDRSPCLARGARSNPLLEIPGREPRPCPIVSSVHTPNDALLAQFALIRDPDPELWADLLAEAQEHGAD